jgi:ABC-2 type transport system permease protein
MNGLAMLTWNETKLLWRERSSMFFSIAFPTLLVVILGSIPGFREPAESLGGQRAIDLYVPILIAFAMTMLAFQALPTALAIYREKGILRRMAVTPVGPGRVLQAQMLTTLLMAIAAIGTMVLVGRVAFAVPLPRQPYGFALAIVLGSAALFAIGLTIAALAPSGKAANAVGTLLFFPNMFFAGLWMPRAAMPANLREISDYTPLGAGVQALQDATAGMWPHPLQLAVLAAYILVFGIIASKVFRWE